MFYQYPVHAYFISPLLNSPCLSTEKPKLQLFIVHLKREKPGKEDRFGITFEKVLEIVQLSCLHS